MKITDKHLEVMWLCFACPEVMPHSSCLLQKYRDSIVIGKSDMVEELTVDEASSLIKAHEKCLQERTQEKLQKSEHRA